MDSDRLQPVLLGGLLIGVLSALPIVSGGNCCCCLWVISGGMLAVYLRQQNAPFALPASEAALVGLLAGALGGILGVLLAIPIEMMMGPLQRRLLDWILVANPDLPSETRDMIQRFTTPAALAFKLVLGVITGAVFGLLGGLLGVALFKTSLPPAPPPVGRVDVLPPE